jgi:hypothetical protein
MRRVNSQAIWATNRGGGPILKEFWKVYNIWHAVYNARLLEEVMPRFGGGL